jgi:hypothetical protein
MPDPHDLAKDAVIARLLTGWEPDTDDRYWYRDSSGGMGAWARLRTEPMTDREAAIVRAALAELEVR